MRRHIVIARTRVAQAQVGHRTGARGHEPAGYGAWRRGSRARIVQWLPGRIFDRPTADRRDGAVVYGGIVGLGASLDVDIWGKQRAQVAAAIGVQNARQAETSAIELEFSADVAQLYYGIQTTYQLIDLLEQLREVAAFSVRCACGARGARTRAA